MCLFIFGCSGSLVVPSGACPSLQSTGLSLWWLLSLQGTGSRAGASAAAAPGCRAEAQQLWLMGIVALQHVGSSPSAASVSAHFQTCVLLVLAFLDFLSHAIWDLPGSLNAKQLVLNCVLATFHIMSWNLGSYWNPTENAVSFFIFFFLSR